VVSSTYPFTGKFCVAADTNGFFHCLALLCCFVKRKLGFDRIVAVLLCEVVNHIPVDNHLSLDCCGTRGDRGWADWAIWGESAVHVGLRHVSVIAHESAGVKGEEC